MKECQWWPICSLFLCPWLYHSNPPTTQGLTVLVQSVECSDRAAPAWQCTWTGTISYLLLPPSRTVDGHNLNMETSVWQQGRPGGLSMGCRWFRIRKLHDVINATITVMLTLGQNNLSTFFHSRINKKNFTTYFWLL